MPSNLPLLKCKMLSEHQSGFQPRDSTVNQLTDIFNTISSNLDKGKDLRFVFCDISKAFDPVWYLRPNGNIFKWFRAYLSDRKQSVVFEGFKSNTKLITAGVPQGSVLGPFLFLLFINDITNNITSNIKLFADDTSLYVIVHNENDLGAPASILNNDLSIITAWANKWQILFNPNKTVAITFTRKHDNLHPPLVFNNHTITQHTHHKHLGLTFNCKGTWSDHISNIYEKASSRLNILRLLKYKVDRNTLKSLYVSYIRPVLEYSDIVWDNCNNTESDLLESIQLEAMRIITGLRRGTSHQVLYMETQLETLQTRRLNHKLTLMYKIINKHTPAYLFNIIQPFMNTNNTYTFRNNRIFNVPLTRTNSYKNSFFSSTMNNWNALDDNIRNSMTISSFKNKLKKHSPITISETFINCVPRRLNVVLCQLRNQASDLNYDKFSDHLVEDCTCPCGANIENTEHFFFHCPHFNNIRHHITSIRNLLGYTNIHVLLNGVTVLSNQTNKTILSHVDSYIKESKRFSIYR